MTGATVPVVEIEAVLNALAYNLSGEGLRVLKAADGEQSLLLRAEIDIPILMLSARGEEQDRVYGLEVGADDYVVKSFVLRELIARARAGLRRRAVPAQPRAVLSAVR